MFVLYIYIYICRFQNLVLRCPTHRLHCFLSSHWPSFRFLSFIVFLIQSGAKRTHVFFYICLRFLSLVLPQIKFYVRKFRTVDDLKESIREEIAIVPQEMLVNVMQNFEERLRTCVRQEGLHLSDKIFRNWVINVSNQNCIYYRLFWC